jgi:hypothetical protein
MVAESGARARLRSRAAARAWNVDVGRLVEGDPDELVSISKGDTPGGGVVHALVILSSGGCTAAPRRILKRRELRLLPTV